MRPCHGCQVRAVAHLARTLVLAVAAGHWAAIARHFLWDEHVHWAAFARHRAAAACRLRSCMECLEYEARPEPALAVLAAARNSWKHPRPLRVSAGVPSSIQTVWTDCSVPAVPGHVPDSCGPGCGNRAEPPNTRPGRARVVPHSHGTGQGAAGPGRPFSRRLRLPRRPARCGFNSSWATKPGISPASQPGFRECTDTPPLPRSLQLILNSKSDDASEVVRL